MTYHWNCNRSAARVVWRGSDIATIMRGLDGRHWYILGNHGFIRAETLPETHAIIRRLWSERRALRLVAK